MAMIPRNQKHLAGAGRLAMRLFAGLACIALISLAASASGEAGAADGYGAQARPLIQQYCLGCHSTAKHKGDLDLERFPPISDLRKGIARWQSVGEMLEREEMPPNGKPQPTAAERDRLLR